MEATLAVLGIIGGLVPLLIWWVKRKRAPIPDERKEDVRQQYSDTLENVHHLRSLGNHAEADAMLRRLAAGVGVRHNSKLTIGIDNAYGQCVGNYDSEGKPCDDLESGNKKAT